MEGRERPCSELEGGDRDKKQVVTNAIQKSHVEPPRNDFRRKSSGTEKIIIMCRCFNTFNDRAANKGLT